MSQTATIVASFATPLAPGQINASPPFGATVPVTFTALVPGEVIPLYGAQTYTVDLAMMPATGLTGLTVTVDKTDGNGGAVTTPVHVTFGAGLSQIANIPIGPGGAFSYATPALASGGITTLVIVTTANAVVRVAACG